MSTEDTLAESPGKRRNSSLKRSRIQNLDSLRVKEEKWTVFSSSQHLPSALADPTYRETDLFTKTWGDSFIPHAPLPPSTLPDIQIGDFLCYLKETSSGRKSHRAIVREAENSRSTPTSPASPAPTRQVEIDGRMYDLNNIPNIFLQKDFSLQDPHTFLQVLPLPHLIPSPVSLSSNGPNFSLPMEGNMATLQSTKLLHERLTHHLDVVEVHLAHQISLRSDIFFETLTSQRQLELLIMQVRQDALELRHQVRMVDKTLTHPSLSLYKFHRHSTRLTDVCQLLQRIATVHQTQHTIQLLLGTSDFVGALELIATTQSILRSELQGVLCLRHLGPQLFEMERAIEHMMEKDFVNIAEEDLRNRVRFSDSVERIGSPEGTDTELQLESIVKGLLRRRKLRFLATLAEKLLHTSKARVKEIVEDFLQISSDSSETDAKTIASRMRELPFEVWFKMMDHVFKSILSYMRHIQKMLAIIINVCQEMGGISGPVTPLKTPTSLKFNIQFGTSVEETEGEGAESVNGKMGEEEVESVSFAEQEASDRLDQLLMEEEMSDDHIMTLAMSTKQEREGEGNGETGSDGKNRDKQSPVSEGAIITPEECQEMISDCHELLCSSCELLHSRCTKIVNFRAKAGLIDDLAPEDFVRLVRLIGRFVSSSAGVTGRQCPHLRLALLSQAKNFLNNFHQKRKSKLNILLEGERWRQAEVPPEIQRLTALLEEGIAPNSLPYDGEANGDGGPKKTVLTSQSSIHTDQYLSVHKQKFAVVGVFLLLIQMITDYCHTVDDLPMLITDVLIKLVDMLKSFNVRACQLVLGAGAVEVVGLKTITTRHLALVLRCLQALMIIIPDIKSHFRRRLTPKQCVLLLNFDQVQEDIGTHCREINHKIIGIMKELVSKFITKWDIKSPVPSLFFKTITKQLLKLHEALDDLLPPNHLQALFQEIEDAFKLQLKNHLVAKGVTNNGSTEHGIVNSELTLMRNTLEPLDHITAFGNGLFDVWTINR